MQSLSTDSLPGAPSAGSPAFRTLLDWLMPIAVAALLVWLGVVRYAPRDPTAQSDFRRFFYHSTTAYLAGEDMYTRESSPTAADLATGSTLWNLNPPHFHLLVLPVAGFPLLVAHALWQILGLICLAVSVWLIRREIGASWHPLLQLFVLFFVLASPSALFQLCTGQLGWLLLLPTTAMWLAARRGRWLTAGLLLGLLAGVKPFFLVFAPYFLITRRWHALAGVGLALAGSLALGLAVFGVENHRSWLSCLGQASGWSGVSGNGSLMGALARSLSGSGMYAPVAHLSSAGIKGLWILLGGALGLLTLTSARGDTHEQIDRAFALLLLAALLLSPLSWAYYYFLPLGPTLAVIARWSGDTRADTRWCLLGLSVPLFFLSYEVSMILQPHPIGTLLFGNLFFWPVFGIWLALLLDAGRQGAGSSAAPAGRTPAAPVL
jgi:hypothetical protein